MTWQFYVAVYGSLALVIGLVSGGVYFGHSLMIVAGVGLVMLWIVAMFWFASAMNTDR